MPGLVLAIHAFRQGPKNVDARDKPGHDAPRVWNCKQKSRPIGPALVVSILPPRLFHERVLAVLHREQDARALVEAVAVLLGEIVDTLARRKLLLRQQRLADRFAEFRRAGL